MDKTLSSTMDYERRKHSEEKKKIRDNCTYCQMKKERKKKERREAKKLAKTLKKMCFEKKDRKPKAKSEPTPMATDEPTTSSIVSNQPM